MPKTAPLESAQSADGKGEGEPRPGCIGGGDGNHWGGQAELDILAGEAGTALTIISSKYQGTAEEEFIGVAKGVQEKLRNWLLTPTDPTNSPPHPEGICRWWVGGPLRGGWEESHPPYYLSSAISS